MFECLGSGSAEALVRLAQGLKAAGFAILAAHDGLDEALDAAACASCGDGPCAGAERASEPAVLRGGSRWAGAARAVAHGHAAASCGDRDALAAVLWWLARAHTRGLPIEKNRL